MFIGNRGSGRFERMEQRTWPSGSDGRQVPHAFSSLLTSTGQKNAARTNTPATSSSGCNSGGSNSRRRSRRGGEIEKEVAVANDSESNFRMDGKRQSHCREGVSATDLWNFGGSQGRGDFASLPFDLLRRIAGSFTIPNLMAASMVCRSWKEGLAPLREAMLFVQWGKKFKHGKGGVSRNIQKALDSFLKGAARGSAAAMVDAGLLLWEMGRRDEGIQLYKKAAQLGDPAGQCNLGLSYLQGILIDRACPNSIQP